MRPTAEDRCQMKVETKTRGEAGCQDNSKGIELHYEAWCLTRAMEEPDSAPSPTLFSPDISKMAAHSAIVFGIPAKNSITHLCANFDLLGPKVRSPV